MELSELSTTLRRAHEAWWKALLAKEWVWAAYYANDMESLVRQITNQTHKLVEEKHADPKSALGQHPRAGVPPEKGD